MTGTVTIERPIPGLLVVTSAGRRQMVRRRFLALDSNKRLDGVAAYASKLAAEMGARMIDKTERLSPEDCAAIVEAHRADGALFGDKED